MPAEMVDTLSFSPGSPNWLPKLQTNQINCELFSSGGGPTETPARQRCLIKEIQAHLIKVIWFDSLDLGNVAAQGVATLELLLRIAK